MPALLRELHELIPTYANQFMWADERFQLSNLYGEVPEITAVGPLYVNEFYNRRETEVVSSFSAQARGGRGVRNRDQTILVDHRTFYRSECYNQVFRPLGYDDFLWMTVREPGKANGGLICLFRRHGETPFSADEARRLAALEPFLGHALARKEPADVALVDSGETGLIVADGTGRPIYLSSEGRRLLFLVTHPQVGSGTEATAAARLPPALQRICRNLAAVIAGDAVAAAPVHCHRNVWGGFTFRAYRLETEAAASLVGITVTRAEPLPIRLMRATQSLPLTHRQGQVCVLLANGLSHRAIADRLGISPHTVIAHTRAIYSGLDVRSRSELLNRLLTPEASGRERRH